MLVSHSTLISILVLNLQASLGLVGTLSIGPSSRPKPPQLSLHSMIAVVPRPQPAVAAAKKPHQLLNIGVYTCAVPSC